MRANPKPIVGTGGATFVHPELWRECRLVGYHGEGPIRPGPLRLTGRGVRAVAIGRFAGFDGLIDRGWSVDGALADRLSGLGATESVFTM